MPKSLVKITYSFSQRHVFSFSDIVFIGTRAEQPSTEQPFFFLCSTEVYTCTKGGSSGACRTSGVFLTEFFLICATNYHSLHSVPQR